MIKRYFTEEEIKNFNCKHCINYMDCDKNKIPYNCIDFSPVKSILYNKIRDLTEDNYNCATLFSTMYENNQQ